MSAQVLPFPTEEKRREELGLVLEPHRPYLRNFCRKLLSGSNNPYEDADDLVQEVMLNAVRSIAGFRNETSLRCWLCEIALNLLRSRLRTAKFQRTSLLDDLDDTPEKQRWLYATEEPNQETLPQKQMVAIAFSAIHSNEIQVLKDQAWHEMEIEEIACKHGRSHRATRSWLQRIRTRSRKALAEVGVTHYQQARCG